MKAQEKYVFNRLDHLDVLLAKQAGEYNTVTFHKLRVEIKKLDAIFNLVNFFAKDFRRKKKFRPFKQIFIAAGRIREIEVEDSVLKKYFRTGSLAGYRKSLQGRKLKEQEIFFNLVKESSKDLIKKTAEEIRPLVKEVTMDEARNFLSKKKNKIIKILRVNNLKNASLHSLRKQVKRYDYLINCFHIEEKNLTLPVRKKFTVNLGKWHDVQVTVKHLKNLLKSGTINQKERMQIKMILSDLYLKNKQYLAHMKSDIPARISV